MERIVKIPLLLIGIFLGLNSCGSSAEKEWQHISETSTKLLTGEMVLPSAENTNMFYDLAITPHYTGLLDFHSDTILKIYPNNQWDTLTGIALKGNGPNDLIFPFFSKQTCPQDEFILTDLNAWTVNHINPTIQNKKYLSVQKAPILSEMPPFQNATILPRYTIASDVDIQNPRLCFIHDTQTHQTTDIPYYPIVEGEYKPECLSFLYDNQQVAHEENQCICIAMKKMNLIHFYNFEGNRQKTIVIGKELHLPQPDSQFLDFPNAPVYTLDAAATSKYIYCLYGGEKSSASTLFLFDWEGNHSATFQLDKPLTKIAVCPDNTYILGLFITPEGGTDIIKYTSFEL